MLRALRVPMALAALTIAGRRATRPPPRCSTCPAASPPGASTVTTVWALVNVALILYVVVLGHGRAAPPPQPPLPGGLEAAWAPDDGGLPVAGRPHRRPRPPRRPPDRGTDAREPRRARAPGAPARRRPGRGDGPRRDGEAHPRHARPTAWASAFDPMDAAGGRRDRRLVLPQPLRPRPPAATPAPAPAPAPARGRRRSASISATFAGRRGDRIHRRGAAGPTRRPRSADGVGARLRWPPRDVAQPGSAPPLGGGGPRFESGRPDRAMGEPARRGPRPARASGSPLGVPAPEGVASASRQARPRHVVERGPGSRLVTRTTQSG